MVRGDKVAGGMHCAGSNHSCCHLLQPAAALVGLAALACVCTGEAGCRA